MTLTPTLTRPDLTPLGIVPIRCACRTRPLLAEASALDGEVFAIRRHRHHGPTMTTAPTRGRSRRVVGPCPVCGAMPVVSCADTATAAQVASEQSWTHLAVTSTGEFRSPTGAPIPEPARPPRRTEPIPFRDLRAALVDGLTAVTR